MLEYFTHTIFQVCVHSGSTAVTVKAKKGGRRENEGVKARAVCDVTVIINGQTGERDRRRSCVVLDGVWSSEVPHVPVVCPAGVGPAVDAVPPVSLS